MSAVGTDSSGFLIHMARSHLVEQVSMMGVGSDAYEKVVPRVFMWDAEVLQ